MITQVEIERYRTSKNSAYVIGQVQLGHSVAGEVEIEFCIARQVEQVNVSTSKWNKTVIKTSDKYK